MQVSRPVEAPWLAREPHLWANDCQARVDGLTRAPEDFAPDGTHPSEHCREKVAHLRRE